MISFLPVAPYFLLTVEYLLETEANSRLEYSAPTPFKPYSSWQINCPPPTVSRTTDAGIDNPAKNIQGLVITRPLHTRELLPLPTAAESLATFSRRCSMFMPPLPPFSRRLARLLPHLPAHMQ